MKGYLVFGTIAEFNIASLCFWKRNMGKKLANDYRPIHFAGYRFKGFDFTIAHLAQHRQIAEQATPISFSTRVAFIKIDPFI